MKINVDQIIFDENGLIPAIVQDQRTGKVLMLAYMNEEAFQKTIETKETWFYSRSRKELWNKGATSGNRQQVMSITLDCDQDAVLMEVIPMGPACHTGEETCFYEEVYRQDGYKRDIIYELANEIKTRKRQPVEGSYTNYLFTEGIDKILKKIGEETSEVIIGAKNEDEEELTYELADLVYHALVLMEASNVTITDVKRELASRRMERANDEDE